MKKIIRSLVAVSIFYFLTAGNTFAFENSYARQKMISATLDCLDQVHANNLELGWQDVCYMDSDGYNNSAKNLAVDKDLNQFETSPIHVTPSRQLAKSGKTQQQKYSFPAQDLYSNSDRQFSMKLDDDQQSPHSFNLGKEISMIRYIESPDFIKEKGNMYGVFAEYLYQSAPLHLSSKLFSEDESNSFVNMFKLDGKFSLGEVDYKSASGEFDNLRDYMAEVRGVLGSTVEVSQCFGFTPYTGLGFRYLFDGLDKAPSGYGREITYFYAPIGVELHNKLATWLLDTTLEYDYFISGRVKSHLEDVDIGYDTATNHQSNGYGLRSSMRLTKVNKKLNFFVEPFVRYWNVDKSNQQPEVFNGTPTGFTIEEPKNNSTESGLKLGLHY